jgi:hypothetical protein
VQTGRRVFGVLAIGSPIAAPRAISRIRLPFTPTLDDQMAAFAARIVRLVPLQLLVSHESVFEPPVARVRGAVMVKFVRPHEYPAVVCGGAFFGRRTGLVDLRGADRPLPFAESAVHDDHAENCHEQWQRTPPNSGKARQREPSIEHKDGVPWGWVHACVPDLRERCRGWHKTVRFRSRRWCHVTARYPRLPESVRGRHLGFDITGGASLHFAGHSPNSTWKAAPFGGHCL